MQPDSDTAPVEPVIEPTTPVVEEKPDYSNPNDLTFEMTDEQEAEFVKQVLETGNYVPEETAKPEPVPETPVTEVPVATPITPEVPAATPTPVDLASPQTDDLWIEVPYTVIDDDGNSTTETVKLVYDPSDPSSFIPEDFTATTKQLADIMDAKAEMAKIYGDREQEFNTKQEELNQATQESELIKGWDTEIADLIDSGLIPKPKVEVTDPKYKDDDSVKLTTDVFQFMTEQNTERAKRNLPPINSFGTAFTLWKNDADRKAAADAKAEKDKVTKQKGAMIGGVANSGGNGAPQQKSYKSGSYNNIWSVPVED